MSAHRAVLIEELRAAGLSLRAIGKRVGLNRSTVSLWCIKLDIEPHPMCRPTRPSTNRAVMITELHAAGVSLREIGKRVGLSHSAVRLWCIKLDIAPRPAHRPIGPNTLKAREMLAAGKSPAEVAQALGVTRDHILRLEGDIGVPSRNSPLMRKLVKQQGALHAA